MGKHEPVFGEEMHNQLSLRQNFQAATYVRIYVSLVAGLAVGILGITGWSGFLYYFAAHLLASVLLWQKAEGKIDEYFPTRNSLLFGEVFGSTALLTFILFWTLANNFIHLF